MFASVAQVIYVCFVTARKRENYSIKIFIAKIYYSASEKNCLIERAHARARKKKRTTRKSGVNRIANYAREYVARER